MNRKKKVLVYCRISTTGKEEHYISKVEKMLAEYCNKNIDSSTSTLNE